jgi:hypothetical protein
MQREAATAGTFTNPLTNQQFERLKIVTIADILKGDRMALPMMVDILRRSGRRRADNQSLLEL